MRGAAQSGRRNESEEETKVNKQSNLKEWNCRFLRRKVRIKSKRKRMKSTEKVVNKTKGWIMDDNLFYVISCICLHGVKKEKLDDIVDTILLFPWQHVTR